jgi:transcriptional regulator with XRE-family HTH domain
MELLILTSPREVALKIAEAVKNKRLNFNMSQKTLSQKSNVSLSTLKKFEATGKISLESLLLLAQALDSLTEFLNLFLVKEESIKSMKDLYSLNNRKRGRL